MGDFTKEEAFELLDTFYELGGNFIDTANVYQGGQSEEWIGEWMHKTGHRDEMVISTKFGVGYMVGRQVQQSNFLGTGTKSLHLAVDASLKKLQTDYIDLVGSKYFMQ
jgi:aryl-alcohol dehydrogenase-like predicted oxidoreductase